MKVLQLGPYPPPHGGVQTNLVAIHRYLHARGIPCAAINLTRYRQKNAEDVYYPKSAWGVLQLLFQLDYDIAHLHVGGNFSFRLLALGAVCSLLPGKKVVLTFHSGGYPSSRAGIMLSRSKLRMVGLRRFDRIIAVNSEIVRFFAKSGFPSSRIRLIPPYPTFRLSAENGLTAKLAAFFEAHDPILLSVGGLEPEYNIPIQIDTLGNLQKSLPRAGLVVIGGGSLERELKTVLKGYSYCHDILLCGDVPHEVTLHAIQRAHVLLRTTAYDGDSIAVREALQLGTPVVATDNGMRPGAVKLIPQLSVETLTTAIEECLRNPTTSAPMSETAAETNLAEVLNVYNELLACSASESASPLGKALSNSLPTDF